MCLRFNDHKVETDTLIHRTNILAEKKTKFVFASINMDKVVLIAKCWCCRWNKKKESGWKASVIMVSNYLEWYCWSLALIHLYNSFEYVQQQLQWISVKKPKLIYQYIFSISNDCQLNERARKKIYNHITVKYICKRMH